MIGVFELSDTASAVPESGLGIRRHRVELFEERNPNGAWLSELEVLGDLPFHKGETRRVKIRIMNDEFRDYVEADKPKLSVRHGANVVGSLTVL